MKKLVLALGVLLALPAVAAEEVTSPARAEPLRLTLADCVTLALKGNRTVQKAYLDRIVQQLDLKVARRQFAPQGLLSSSARADGDRAAEANGTGRGETVQLLVTQQVPIGGQFSFTWSGSSTRPLGASERQAASAWQLAAVQPLLRGAGTAAGTQALFLARLQEQGNVLALRSTLMSVVTSAIVAFRQLILAEREVGIRRSALERGHELMEINKALIAAGRMAEVELVQAEADISSRKLSLSSAENTLEAARLALLQLLVLDKSLSIEPVEDVDAGVPPPALAEALDLAFRNRPDLLQAELSLQASARSLALARNNMLPDLDLELGIENSAAGSSWSRAMSDSKILDPSLASWYGALKLSVPLNDLTRRQTLVRARVELEKSRLDMDQTRDEIETEVRDAVRNAESARKQLLISRQGRALSEKKLEIEREKLRTGRSTNFQVVNFQNDLVDAQTTELGAAIAYLDALTALDQTLGTTLDTWRIEVREADTKPPQPGANREPS